MQKNVDAELQLLEQYGEDIHNILFGKESIGIIKSSKSEFSSFINQAERTLSLYKKQGGIVISLLPEEDKEILNDWNSEVYYYQGRLTLLKGMYLELHPGIFNSSINTLTEAIKHFDKSISYLDSSEARFLKVLCFRILKYKKDALKELEKILEIYHNDSEVYLAARKEIDDIESESGALSVFLTKFRSK